MKLVFSLAILSVVVAGCNGEKLADTSEQNKKWLGSWVRIEWQNAAELGITKVSGDTLSFGLFASHGASLSELEGVALIKGNKAVFLPKDGELADCTLTFELKGDTAITITEGEGDCLSGVFVWYAGTYTNSKLASTKAKESYDQRLAEIGPLDSIQDERMKELTGNDYELFVQSTQEVVEEEDTVLHAKVFTTGIQGLYTQMENIIIVNSQNDIWGAVIDDEKVYYYTTRPEHAHELPESIKNWMSRFKDYPVTYKSNPNP